MSSWILHTGFTNSKLFLCMLGHSLCILSIYFIANNMLSQLCANNCTSCFSVLFCPKHPEQSSRISDRFASWMACNTPCKVFRCWKMTVQMGSTGKVQPFILYIPKGHNQMLFRWDSKWGRTQWMRPIHRQRIYTQQTVHLSRPPLLCIVRELQSFAELCNQNMQFICLKNKAGKGYQHHLNFCRGSAPETTVLKFTFSSVFTGHLISMQHRLQLRERPFLFIQSIEKKSRKTHARPKLDIEKGTSLLHLLLTEVILLQKQAACLLFLAGGLS